MKIDKLWIKVFIVLVFAGILWLVFVNQEKKKPNEEYTVAFITFYNDFFMQTVQSGVIKRSKERGVTVISASSELDLEKESNLIDDFITRGVDAILITPISLDGSIASLKKAKKAGITVVNFNTTINDPSIVSSFIYTDGRVQGALSGVAVAKYIKETMDGKAKIGILNCEEFELCVARKNGFLDELKGLEVTIVANQKGFVADKAITVAEDMLQGYPEIDLLWAENEGGTVGLVQALNSLRLKIPVFGLDMNLQLGQMMLEPNPLLRGTSGQSPFELGVISIDTTVDILEGKKVDQEIYSPAIYFGIENKEKIQKFLEVQGKDFFK